VNALWTLKISSTGVSYIEKLLWISSSMLLVVDEDLIDFPAGEVGAS
jgi:hypothetical protein